MLKAGAPTFSRIILPACYIWHYISTIPIVTWYSYVDKASYTSTGNETKWHLSYIIDIIIIIIINAVDPSGVSYRRQNKGVYMYNSEGLN